jgi:short chain dehydrogenase
MKLEVASIMTGMLEGKAGLITGAPRGIGRAIAEKFARDGAAFIGIDYGNHEAAARDAVSRIKALGAEAVALQAELTWGKAHAGKLWSTFAAAAGKDVGSIELDMRVNNAGIAPAVSLVIKRQRQSSMTSSRSISKPRFSHAGCGPPPAQGWSHHAYRQRAGRASNCPDGTRVQIRFSVAETTLRCLCTRCHGESTSTRVWCSSGGAPVDGNHDSTRGQAPTALSLKHSRKNGREPL